MNLSYVTNQTTDTAIMNLYGPIGSMGIDGSMFADQLLYLENMGYKNVDIRINSPGGSVLDGFSIFSAIRNCNMRGKTQVNTYVDYLAASIAGVIALSGNRREIASNGRFMMHNVAGPDSTDKDKEVLNDLKQTIIDVFQAIAGEDIDFSDLMDKETWLNPSKAIKMGFFHDQFSAIVPENSIANSIEDLYSYSNKYLTTNKIKMADNTEMDALKAKLSALEARQTALEAENATLKNTISDKEAIIKKNQDKEAVTLVENAIKEGKITKDSREKTIEAAKLNFDAVKNVLESIPTTVATRFTNFVGSGESREESKGSERAEWTHRDWEKKDPKGLQNLYKNDPEKANELYNKTYNN